MTTTARRKDKTVALPHLTVAERTARGRQARAEVPRSTHAACDPPASRPDPIDLLEAQAQMRVSELVPIRSVDDRELGDPGPTTRKLSEVFWSAVKGDLEQYSAWNEYV